LSSQVYPKLQLDDSIHLKSSSACFCQIISLLAIITLFIVFKEKRINFEENNPKIGYERSLGTIVLDTKTILNKIFFPTKIII